MSNLSNDINEVKEWLFEVINERDTLKHKMEEQQELKTKYADLEDIVKDLHQRLIESQQNFAE